MEEDDEVCRGEMFESWNVVGLEFLLMPFFRVNRHGGIDESLIVYSEQDCAVEAVMLAKNSGHHGHGLFTPIFLVSGDEDDVFSFSRSIATRVGKPSFVFGNRVQGCGRNEWREEKE